ncbi:MAG: DUF4369 domain-containing protein [Flavobacteriaceae bacterium]|nr:DUF4369 domain-containing protein [Flavobacteriaceae bacterium]
MNLIKVFLTISVVGLLFTSCNEAGVKENEMKVEGHIKGLKKGTLYLQRAKDTLVETIDSVVFKGDAKFAFQIPLESPEVFYLKLNKPNSDPERNRILFFGEPGIIKIQSTWDQFDFKSKISGSDTHELLQEYRGMMRKFNNKNLDFIKASFLAKKNGDSLEVDSIQKLINKNKLRQYLFSLNYALTHKDSYISPYIALSEVYDANVKYLDTINNALTENVANSKYGKQLDAYIQKIKQKEGE